MADINNFSDINENFDTIKTMLNSIRAQGVLNTSDVDKLLENINSKLQKINTEEDIDLIKAFLSELKKTLDERHDVLISKFGAIESLFSNLLKNSTDSVKSSELKELFDIIATNLSVFSKEVISQKETLTDITLRLDALRSDETQKKEIIKNISVVRNDIEKLNNGFDSIVISLNENFKTVLKTISEIDQSEEIKAFAQQLDDIITSSNTILSAIQLIDKKNDQFEEAFEKLAKQDDTTSIQRNLIELTAQSQRIANLVDTLSEKSYKIDNLADKIDASVNIIAGLKADIKDKDIESNNLLLDKLSELESAIKGASSEREYEEFKAVLQNIVNDMANSSGQLKESFNAVLNDVHGLNNEIKALDINDKFKNLSSGMDGVREDLKEKIVSEADKLSQMVDVHITRTLKDIASNADTLNSRLKDSYAALSGLCEKNFLDVSGNISGLKDIVAQLDENNVSANNAIFSNITDRLAIFENSLKSSLEKQEDFVSGSSSSVFEQISNVKNLAEGIEYKLDSNAIELGNSKREFKELTESVNKVLALDFVQAVKDVKVELYAVKQDLTDAVESSESNITDKLTNDLFGKYELLISKLDSVEDELKLAQKEALDGLNDILSKISSSIVDILSYVSTVKEANNDVIEAKLSEVTTFIQDSNLNYIENVRDIVDVIRSQVEANLKQMSADADGRLVQIKREIVSGDEALKKEIRTSYSKLIEVQDNIGALNEMFNKNNGRLFKNVSDILSSSDSLKQDFEGKMNALKSSLLDMVTEFKTEFTCENADKISELKFNAETLHSQAVQQSVDLKNELKTEIDGIVEALRMNISDLKELVSTTTLKIEGANREVINFVKNDFTSDVNNSVDLIKTNTADVLSEIDNKVVDVVTGFNSLERSVNNLSTDTTTALSSTLAKILDNFVALNASMANYDSQSAERLKENADELKKDFESVRRKLTEVDITVDEDLSRQISIIEGSFESLNLMLVDIINQATDSLGDRIKKELAGASDRMSEALAEELEQYKVQIEELFEGLQGKNNEQAEYIKECAIGLKDILSATLDEKNSEYVLQLEDVGNKLKEMLNENIEQTTADYDSLKLKVSEFTDNIAKQNNLLVDGIKQQIDEITKFLDSNLEVQTQEVNTVFDEISAGIQKAVTTVNDFDADWAPKLSELKPSIDKLSDSVQTLLQENNADIRQDLDDLKTKLDEDEQSRRSLHQSQMNELTSQYSLLLSDIKEFTREELATVSNMLIKVNQDGKEESDLSLSEKIDQINEYIEAVKQNVSVCNDVLKKLVIEHSNILSKSIEKETDIIVGDIIEQSGMLKDSLKDDLNELSALIEGSISGYIIDSVNDLKSYLDVKTDASVIDGKLDNLRLELEKSIDETTENINKLLELSVFNDAVIELKTTNEVLVTSLAEKLNSQIQSFVKENVSVKLEDKINLLDKKFIDTVVDKYEEVKIISTNHEKSIEKVLTSVSEVISKISDVKEELNNNLSSLISGVNRSIDDLKANFADLKAQILNKSFDEAFHESVHNQISGIEKLVSEQMGYIEDISDLCCANLPDLSEMSTIVKFGIQQSVANLGEKLENHDADVIRELNILKSDIITQFINVFNQISFVTEQEEILDFINDKHSELITVLSHIVTTVDGVETLKDNVAVVDNKIDTIKEDIDLINEKITSIMSSEGDIDYVYSLQDLESDIANLRLVLNEMKADNKSKEFEELISSTNNIYQIVETIKNELPKFEAEEFKKGFNSLAEDIVSISTRTNKLLLTSDESYKTLQDNLQDFKLVIDDLDERTRNFAQEAGIDKIDSKLGAINTMIKNGERTNQVFNQVFEYLAEWVDKAGEQINTITDKVETLDDIGQIKVMLEDLRAESQDNNEGAELVDALEKVFAQQAKRIASLESKLDKLIVNSTINKKSRSEVKPIEDTLNKFLIAMDDRISSQQDKINSLEKKLEEFVSLADNKDTEKLTKKVGGMDKQLAKLSKSIEKIASNVVEK